MRKYERLRDETASDNIMNIKNIFKERVKYFQRAWRLSEESVKKI